MHTETGTQTDIQKVSANSHSMQLKRISYIHFSLSFVYLSVCPHACMSVSACMSVCLSFCLFLSLCVFVCLSLSVSQTLSLRLFLSFSLSLSPSFSFSLFLSLSCLPHLSLSLPPPLFPTPSRCLPYVGVGAVTQVMDEADRLLDDNFGAQLEPILKMLPARRQTLLFSATLSPTLTAMKDSVLKKPFVWIQQSE